MTFDIVLLLRRSAGCAMCVRCPAKGQRSALCGRALWGLLNQLPRLLGVGICLSDSGTADGDCLRRDYLRRKCHLCCCSVLLRGWNCVVGKCLITDHNTQLLLNLTWVCLLCGLLSLTFALIIKYACMQMSSSMLPCLPVNLWSNLGHAPWRWVQSLRIVTCVIAFGVLLKRKRVLVMIFLWCA